MKQKLIALLRTSFASKGFNAKELESLADLVIAQNLITEVSTDEDLSTAVTGAAPVADFVQSVASRQVSDAVKPKPVEPVTPIVPVVEPVVPVTTDPVLLALLAEIKEMKTGLSNLNTEKVATTRESQFEPLLKDASPSYKKTMLALAKSNSSMNDADYSAWLETAKGDIAEYVQEIANSGLGWDKPAGGAGGGNASTKEASTTEVEEAFKNFKL